MPQDMQLSNDGRGWPEMGIKWTDYEGDHQHPAGMRIIAAIAHLANGELKREGWDIWYREWRDNDGRMQYRDHRWEYIEGFTDIPYEVDFIVPAGPMAWDDAVRILTINASGFDDYMAYKSNEGLIPSGMQMNEQDTRSGK